MAFSPSPDPHPSSHASPVQLGTPENKELPAPAGWQKKIASTKSGGTPRRGAVYFIAPDGKEINSKRSLEGYLKGNPGGPSVTEFDWSTGETPRRSSRLSTTAPVVSPESGSGKRRVRRKVAIEDGALEKNEMVGATLPKTDEVMGDVEKLKESKAAEIVKPVEKVESGITKEAEIAKPVEKAESGITKEAEKVSEKPEECTIGESVSELKMEMAQTEESLSEVGIEKKDTNGVLPKENGPEEELVKQEVGGEKVQIENAKLEKLLNMTKETPLVEASEEAKHGCEATSNGKISTSEEELKQESSEKLSDELSQLPEAPEASKPNGISL